jgi:hypothetical protein
VAYATLGGGGRGCSVYDCPSYAGSPSAVELPAMGVHTVIRSDSQLSFIGISTLKNGVGWGCNFSTALV